MSFGGLILPLIECSMEVGAFVVAIEPSSLNIANASTEEGQGRREFPKAVDSPCERWGPVSVSRAPALLIQHVRCRHARWTSRQLC